MEHFKHERPFRPDRWNIANASWSLALPSWLQAPSPGATGAILSAILLLHAPNSLACTLGTGSGGKVYVGLQTGGNLTNQSLECDPQSKSTSVIAPVDFESGTRSVTMSLTAAAWESGGSAHASVSSTLIPPQGEDPMGAYPAWALASARAALVFNVIAPIGGRAPITFDLLADGRLSGQRGYFAGNSAYDFAIGGSGINPHATTVYQDGYGVTHNYTSLIWNGHSDSTDSSKILDERYAISYTANFAPGLNGFFFQVDVSALGQSSADFSNTASIAGIHVPDGYGITLPDGLFKSDPNDLGHYILSSLAPVPEPSRWMMLLGGLVLVALRRRGARQCLVDQPAV